MMRLRRGLKAASLLLLALCLTGCGKYVSGYRATLLVRSNTARSAFMEFHTFEGRMVFRLKAREGMDRLRVTADLTSGSAAVYADDGTKQTLFTLTGGEAVEETFGPFESGTLYLIVETDGGCRDGSVRFDLE